MLDNLFSLASYDASFRALHESACHADGFLRLHWRLLYATCSLQHSGISTSLRLKLSLAHTVQSQPSHLVQATVSSTLSAETAAYAIIGFLHRPVFALAAQLNLKYRLPLGIANGVSAGPTAAIVHLKQL